MRKQKVANWRMFTKHREEPRRQKDIEQMRRTERLPKRVWQDELLARKLRHCHREERQLDKMDKILHEYTSNEELEQRDKEWRERAKQERA